MGETGPYTACAVLARYGYGKGLEAPVMALHSPINDKPPSGGNGGLTRPVGGLTLELQLKRDGSLTDCSSPVNHPTTINARCRENSHRPVGEERGVALKSVQRPPIYGHAAHSREACRRTGKPVKSCRLRVRLRKGQTAWAIELGLGVPVYRPSSTTEGSIGGKR